jgi:hypothetical protein
VRSLSALTKLRSATLFCAALLLLTTCGNFLNSPSRPSPVFALTGTVTDAATGETLGGVLVTGQDQAATTGSSGRYAITVTSGRCDLSARRAGYVTFSQSLTVTGSQTIDIQLRPE